jgi:type IV pilus biogenesis/stability protein PilW
MSLIIDALKRAQQLRLKGDQGVPFFKSERPSNEKTRRDSRKRRVLSILGLIGLLVILLMILGNPLPSFRGEKPTFSVVLPGKEKPSILAVSPSQQTETTNLNTDSTEVNLSPLRLEDRDLLSTRSQAEEVEIHPEPRLLTPPSKAGFSAVQRVKKEEPLLKQIEEQKKSKISAPPDKAAKTSLPRTGEVSPQPLETPLPSKQEATPNPPEGTQETLKPLPSLTEVLTLFNQGVLYQNQREMTKAIQTYQRVIELDPAYFEAYNNLGLLYQEIGDFDRARQAYQKAIEINPRYEKALNNLGILFYLKDRYEEALESFQKAITAQPDNIESYLNLGILFKKQGQWNKAMESFQKAFAINPISGEAHYNMALLYEQTNQVEVAIDHYKKFIRLSSKTYPVLVSKVQKHLENLSKMSQEHKK